MFCGFALSAGVLLHWVDFSSILGKVWVTLSMAWVVLVVWGTLSGEKAVQGPGYLFPVMILYLLGWILFSLVSLPDVVAAIWAGLGWVLFTLIGVSVILRSKGESGQGFVTRMAVDLFVVSFNIFWLAAMFWQAVD